MNFRKDSLLFTTNMVLVNNSLYEDLHDKITKMTKSDLQKREKEIYDSDLSFIYSDRTLIYMELGIITQLLYIFQKNWKHSNQSYEHYTFTKTIWGIVVLIAISTPESLIRGPDRHTKKEKSKEKRTKTTKNSWHPFAELIFAVFVGSIRETTSGLLAPGTKTHTNALTAFNFNKN